MTPHQTPQSVPTDEMVKAAQDRVDEELMRQYAANPTWEEAKDVIENLDSAAIVRVVLAGRPSVPLATPLEAQLAEARQAVALFENYGCPICHGDCAAANPPVYCCPMEAARRIRERGAHG